MVFPMMKQLFNAVRSSTGTNTWSKGVALTRNGAVLGQEWSQQEVVLTVMESKKPVNPVVTLWPEEEDWNCDCGSPDDPCEHVVAAIIAINQANEKGEPLPRASSKVASIEYYFSAVEDQLSFKRIASHDGQKEILAVSLSALASGRISGPKLAPTKEDLTVDHIIDGHRKGGTLPPMVLKEVIKSLSTCDRVFFEGEPIICKAEAIGATAQINDTPSGVYVKSEKDRRIKKVYKNGAVIGNSEEKTLHPLLQVEISKDLRQMLREGRLFGNKEIHHLVSEVIPKLKEALPLEIKSSKLPTAQYLKPKLVWQSQAKGNQLLAYPVIAYGTPPCAVVENGQLIPKDSNIVPVRMLEDERKLADELTRRFPDSELNKAISYDAAEAVSFLDQLEAKGFEVMGQGKEYFQVFPELSLTLPEQLNINKPFDIIFESVGADSVKKLANPEHVLNSWLNDEPLVPLLDGGFAPIPSNFLERHGAKILDLIRSRDNEEMLPKCMLPSLAELYNDLGNNEPAALTEWSKLLAEFEEIPSSPLPSDLQAELRPYQRQGFNWLTFLQNMGMGALLADDMGLGKTLQTIACIKGKTLVIAPTSVLENWRKELKKFRPGLNCSIFHGQNRKLDSDAQVIISSYALLRIDFEVFDRLAFDMLVLDEAQTIKNPRSQSAQSAFRLKASFKIALSGTPVENKLEDMWSIFNFLNRGLLGNFEHFQKVYAKPILAGQAGVGERLRKRVKPFVLRRLKSEVASDLPPRTDVIRYCALNEQERDTYEALRLASQKEIVEKLEKGGQIIQALELLLRLRQAACHLGLLPQSSNPQESSSKLDLLLDCLKNSTETKNKCLVFSQWTKFLDLIEHSLQESSIPCLRIDGQTKNRQEIVDRFQNDTGVGVLLLSLKAAGVGLNLTAADHVFITDPWWNPAAENQAADRAHRIGQKKPVIVTRLVSEDTVEQKILLLQEKKKALADAVVSSAGASFALSKEDLLGLLT